MGIHFGLKRFPLRVGCFEPCFEAGIGLWNCGSNKGCINLFTKSDPRPAHPVSGVRVEGKCNRDWETRWNSGWLLECEDSRVILAKLWVNRPAADWIAVKCGIYGESGLLKVCFGTLNF